MRQKGVCRLLREDVVDVKIGKNIIPAVTIVTSVEVTGITLDTEVKIHHNNRVFVASLSETLDGDYVFYTINGEGVSRSDWLKLLCRSQQ